MGIYIKGIGIISPQKAFDASCFEKEILPFNNNRLSCCEPDYSSFIDTKQIRRMSNIIKMGVTASIIAMKDAGIEKLDAVIVGTGLGCLEDTTSFLKKMIEFKEDMLNPTAFIHSTHNTIASQIGLVLGCEGYNSTYSHRNISFESALMDGILLLKEKVAENILAGGIDELTETSFNILSRMGHFKKSQELTDGSLYNRNTKGSIGGEGSAFFTIGNTPDTNSYAAINSVHTISFSSPEEVAAKAKVILTENGIEKADILIAGYNGDMEDDKIFDEVASYLDMTNEVIKYKHLCGEFSTSTGFALWMAANIIKRGNVPTVFENNFRSEKKINHILIYNQNNNLHHSLILISSC